MATRIRHKNNTNEKILQAPLPLQGKQTSGTSAAIVGYSGVSNRRNRDFYNLFHLFVQHSKCPISQAYAEIPRRNRKRKKKQTTATPEVIFGHPRHRVLYIQNLTWGDKNI